MGSSTTTVIEVTDDFCDHCGTTAQAYLYASMPSGRVLTYCGSRGTRYLPGLLNQGATAIDHRDQIVP